MSKNEKPPEGETDSTHAQDEANVGTQAAAPAAPADHHVAGVNHLRTVDPQARVMWTIKGAKDEAGAKISQVLMKVGDQGRTFVLLSSNAFGFTTYVENDLTAPA